MMLFLLLLAALLLAVPASSAGKTVQDTLPAFLPDSVLIAGNSAYRAGKIRSWLLGKNYREEWTLPVKAKVINQLSDAGGFRVIRSLPHSQSRVLLVEDRQGYTWQLRSIEKFPARLLPPEFREGLAREVLIDGLSASYPYGALTIAHLEQAIGKPSPDAELVYLADNQTLGDYQQRFGNMLMLKKSYPDADQSPLTTDSLLIKLRADPNLQVNQYAVLLERLFDLFIQDFNRGDEQWYWIESSRQPGVYLPRGLDRDLFFFLNQGIIPRLLSSPAFLPELQGFGNPSLDIATFNRSNIAFDKTFLNTLSAEEWRAAADSLSAVLSDSLIQTAVHAQPPAILAINGERIIQVLKDRRDRLTDIALDYYRFLSAEIDVAGTNRADLFRVEEDSASGIWLRVSTDGHTLYLRQIFPEETKELRLYGLEGDDQFIVHTNSNTPTIRLIGGEGSDIFQQEGTTVGKSVHVYDMRSNAGGIKGSSIRKHLSSKTAVNRYDRSSAYYDRKGLSPRINLTLDDGLIPGIAYTIVEHGFRKEPHGTLQQFTLDYGLSSGALLLGYRMEAIGFIGKNDLIAEAGTGLPGMVVNFMGYGNESRVDVNGKGYRYYRTRLNTAHADLLLRRRLNKQIVLTAGPAFRYANVRPGYNDDRILVKEPLAGINHDHLFRDKYYLGVKAGLELDTRNDGVIPISGIYLKSSLARFGGLNSFSQPYGQYTADLAGYFHLDDRAKLVFALRIGGGITSGQAEYFQHQFLSGHTNLRGYRRFRFAGDKMAYTNIELRYHLLDFRSWFFPGALGLQAFHDMGRVWHQQQSGGGLHHGTGLGIWIAPARRIVGTGSFIFSKEGPIPYFTLGFRF